MSALAAGANHLVAVPGGGDGPGGVLVCAENFIIYKSQNPGHEDVRAVIPRRSSLSGDRGVLIVCAATHRTKQQFFFLAQSEYGDLYKVTVVYEKGTETVTEVGSFKSRIVRRPRAPAPRTSHLATPAPPRTLRA
jgi:splicing factor 3B subunit 3